MSKKHDPLTLRCTSCEHENEPERVYCHNCGAKLDRALLPKVEESKEESAGDAQRRVRQMMNPKRSGGFSDIKVGAQMLVFSIIVAALFLVWQKPDGVPEVRKDYMPTVEAGDKWERLMHAPAAASIDISEDDLNLHIKRTLKIGEGFAGVKFVQAVVDLKPGLVTVFVERNLWGLSLYSNVSYKPVVKDGKVTAEVRDIHIGRLGIHPVAAGLVSDWAVTGIWKAYEKEAKQSDRLADIRVEDGRVIFVSKPL